MAKNLPFDDETMTLIMGLGGPEEPGQHGRKMVPAPDQTAVELVSQIKDLCEDFLLSIGNGKEEMEEKSAADQEEEPEEV